MNHLSEDMAAYYIRPQKNLEKEYSETIYRAVFKDGSKMLGTNGDAFVRKINEFIEQNHMNIQDDMVSITVADFECVICFVLDAPSFAFVLIAIQ